jgi:hypothetical protein
MPTKKPVKKKAVNQPALLKKPRRKKAPVVKTEAERIIDAMRELAKHLRNPDTCLKLTAYDKLEDKHKVLFDKLMQAISKRTFGDTQN